jgi:hypothetical protein
MADLRIPGSTPPVPRGPTAPVRTDTARAAQRAFFQAALGQSQATPQASPAGPKPPVAAAPAVQQTAPDPQRPLRPGSLLDIKV